LPRPPKWSPRRRSAGCKQSLGLSRVSSLRAGSTTEVAACLSRSWVVLQSLSGSVPTRSAFAGPPAALGIEIPGPWRFPEPALTSPDKSGSARSSLMNLPSPSKFPSHWLPRLFKTARRQSQVDAAPLMRFSAPSAHQAWRIHTRGFPNPLRSAFAVGSAMTVYSPPCPAGLFHPAALMGFRSSHLSPTTLSRGPPPI